MITSFLVGVIMFVLSIDKFKNKKKLNGLIFIGIGLVFIIISIILAMPH